MAKIKCACQLEEQLYTLQSSLAKLRETSKHHGKLVMKILQCLENLRTAHSLTGKASQTNHVVVHIESEEEDVDTILSLEKRRHRRRKRRPTRHNSRCRRIPHPISQNPFKSLLCNSISRPPWKIRRSLKQDEEIRKWRRRRHKCRRWSASQAPIASSDCGWSGPSSKRAMPSAVPTNRWLQKEIILKETVVDCDATG
ncbi:hypothetical protein MRB53_016037 [Persea americana]|uniref:Uncharacterized protein n=1 Tax=Persea americana TaxID=3435 RepID=A0ACC2M1P3_PERAE|nr:hypothetical protein MRB53_016037 [Persea americana]